MPVRLSDDISLKAFFPFSIGISHLRISGPLNIACLHKGIDHLGEPQIDYPKGPVAAPELTRVYGRNTLTRSFLQALRAIS